MSISNEQEDRVNGDSMGGFDAKLRMSEFLGNNPDPAVAMMFQWWFERQSREDLARKEKSSNARRIRQAGRAMERLKSDLEASEEIRRYVAGISGACEACLGLIRHCTYCDGNGHPGASQPDEALLEWVQPALRRLGYCLSEDQPLDADEVVVGAHYDSLDKEKQS